MEAGTMYDVSSYPAHAWTRLGEAIRRRRVSLGMTQEVLADKAGCSVNTIRNLEQGKKARQLTLPRINRALGWIEDSYVLVLDGGSPVVEDVPDEANAADTLRLTRPDGVSEAAWSEITEQLVADLDRYLKWRGGPR